MKSIDRLKTTPLKEICGVFFYFYGKRLKGKGLGRWRGCFGNWWAEAECAQRFSTELCCTEKVECETVFVYMVAVNCAPTTNALFQHFHFQMFAILKHWMYRWILVQRQIFATFKFAAFNFRSCVIVFRSCSIHMSRLVYPYRWSLSSRNFEHFPLEIHARSSSVRRFAFFCARGRATRLMVIRRKKGRNDI